MATTHIIHRHLHATPPVAVSGDGAYVFVANLVDGTVSEISVATQSVVRTHKVGKGPNGITFQAQ